MELIVAILMALGSLTSKSDFNEEYVKSHNPEVQKAQSIIDNGQYKLKDGGVILVPGEGV